MNKLVTSKWSKSGVIEVLKLERSLFIFRFQSEEAKLDALEVSPVKIGTKMIILSPWSPKKVLKMDLSKIPVWIRLQGLRLQYYTPCTLSKLVSVIGCPLYADRRTLDQSSVAYARVCVEIVAGVKLRNSIRFQDEFGDVHNQTVDYEWLPSLCKHCNLYGQCSSKCVNSDLNDIASTKNNSEESCSEEEEKEDEEILEESCSKEKEEYSKESCSKEREELLKEESCFKEKEELLEEESCSKEKEEFLEESCSEEEEELSKDDEKESYKTTQKKELAGIPNTHESSANVDRNEISSDVDSSKKDYKDQPSKKTSIKSSLNESCPEEEENSEEPCPEEKEDSEESCPEEEENSEESCPKEEENNSSNKAQGRKIFVRGFNKFAPVYQMKGALKRIFSCCGKITSIQVPVDYRLYPHGQITLKGFAFVEFENNGGVENALKLDQTELDKDPLTVAEARPRDDAG